MKRIKLELTEDQWQLVYELLEQSKITPNKRTDNKTLDKIAIHNAFRERIRRDMRTQSRVKVT